MSEDYIMSLPLLQGHRHTLPAVITATGVGCAYPILSADQAHTIKALPWLTAAYGMLLGIASDQGTHFTRDEVQQWATDNDVRQHFHVPY